MYLRGLMLASMTRVAPTGIAGNNRIQGERRSFLARNRSHLVLNPCKQGGGKGRQNHLPVLRAWNASATSALNSMPCGIYQTENASDHRASGGSGIE
jgi:hypothetical protein